MYLHQWMIFFVVISVVIMIWIGVMAGVGTLVLLLCIFVSLTGGLEAKITYVDKDGNKIKDIKENRL